MKIPIILGLLFVTFSSCDDQQSSKKTVYDTILIKSDAAIFYYPGPASLDTLRNVLDTESFASEVSSCTYFMNFASNYVDFVKLNKITINKGKVLKFVNKDKTEHFIDTNTLVEFWGIILFNKYKKPKMIDMPIFVLEYKNYF